MLLCVFYVGKVDGHWYWVISRAAVRAGSGSRHACIILQHFTCLVFGPCKETPNKETDAAIVVEQKCVLCGCGKCYHSPERLVSVLGGAASRCPWRDLVTQHWRKEGGGGGGGVCCGWGLLLQRLVLLTSTCYSFFLKWNCRSSYNSWITRKL